MGVGAAALGDGGAGACDGFWPRTHDGMTVKSAAHAHAFFIWQLLAIPRR